MKIGKHEIGNELIFDYLKSMKWNMKQASRTSDFAQRRCHDHILKAAGFSRPVESEEGIAFVAALEKFSFDMMSDLFTK